MRKQPINKGFSLVELSIVLVILGLLVGGILAGQSLIRASELRAVGTEYNRWLTATAAFKDKYFHLPGDMSNATSFWPASTACSGAAALGAGTCNGNGNGLLGTGAANATSEIFQFWTQLALAGLIESTYTGTAGPIGAIDSVLGVNVPTSELTGGGWSLYNYGTIDINGGGWANFEGYYGNTWVYGARSSSQGFTEAAIMKPVEAWNIDTKLDDGKPGLGKIRTFENNVNCHDAGTSTTVALAATANYSLAITGTACMLTFRAPTY